MIYLYDLPLDSVVGNVFAMKSWDNFQNRIGTFFYCHSISSMCMYLDFLFKH